MNWFWLVSEPAVAHSASGFISFSNNEVNSAKPINCVDWVEAAPNNQQQQPTNPFHTALLVWCEMVIGLVLLWLLECTGIITNKWISLVCLWLNKFNFFMFSPAKPALQPADEKKGRLDWWCCLQLLHQSSTIFLFSSAGWRAEQKTLKKLNH